jgi:GNAT superfamily N-acetyltransferase
MPHSQVQRFTTIDYEREMAIVGVIGKGEGEEIIAVGRYVVDPESNMAEAALLVRDDWQRKGIGSWLQKYLMDIAKSRGIVGFTARVLRENTAALNLAHKSGLTIETKLEEPGVYCYPTSSNPWV